MQSYQLQVDTISWESGPRLTLDLNFFPEYNKSQVLDFSEVQAIATVFVQYKLEDDDVFGPYDLIEFVTRGLIKTVSIQFVLHEY